MLSSAPGKFYIYNGHGHALSGHIESPINQLVEVQAGMSLPANGGVGNARAEKYRLKEFVSFEAAYTHVAGSKSDKDTHTTLVTSTVEQLNVLDVVTADRVVARVASTHKLPDDEARITVFGSKIENLKVAGCPVQVDFADKLFLRLTNFEAVRNEFQNNAEFRKIAADPFLTGQPQSSIDPRGVVLCSIVKDIKMNCPGIEQAGHALIVPEFGTVFIGELISEHRKRTVTMLRIELGCPVTGNVVVAQAMTNGRPYPPS